MLIYIYTYTRYVDGCECACWRTCVRVCLCQAQKTSTSVTQTQQTVNLHTKQWARIQNIRLKCVRTQLNTKAHRVFVWCVPHHRDRVCSVQLTDESIFVCSHTKNVYEIRSTSNIRTADFSFPHLSTFSFFVSVCLSVVCLSVYFVRVFVSVHRKTKDYLAF